MTDQPVLHVQSRTEMGSLAARRARRNAQIPAVLYGHGEPQTFLLDAVEFSHVVHPGHYGSLIVSLREGDREIATALVKVVQKNTLEQTILNVDLQRVSMREKIQVNVPVVLAGDPAGARAGGVLDQQLYTVDLKCRASDVPEAITVDISGMELGDAIHLSDLPVPPESEFLTVPETMVALLSAPRAVGAEEAGIEEEVSGPELVGDKQKDDAPVE